MAWRGVLPLMGGASASAVAVATRPTPIESGQPSPFVAASKGFDGRGETRTESHH